MRKLGLAMTAAIFIVMIIVTVRATMQMSIPAAWDSYAANPWAVATLYDAYSGFFIFWLLVAFRERHWGATLLWFVLIMALGNIATSAYLFWQLWRLGPNEPLQNVFWKRTAQ